jgi:ribose/xylose/arabinose/galactoside ABC-type transport system permease subunit
LISPLAVRAIGVVVLIAVAVAIFTAIEPRYISYPNLSSVTRHTAANGLAALGLTFVVVVRKFDMSFPGIAAFTACTMGFLIAIGQPLGVAVAVGLAVAIVIGLVNGWTISYLGLPDIVVTIGTGSIAAGAAFFFSGGQTIFTNFMSSGLIDLNGIRIFKLNLSVYFLLAAYFVGWMVLQRSRIGNALYAAGDNPVSAAFSGIRVKLCTMAAFGVCGLTAALSALLLIAESGNASTFHGATLMMPAYAAVYLGAALLGGASAPATLAGTVIMTVLVDGFSLIGVPYYYSDAVVSGILLTGVIVFDDRSKRLLNYLLVSLTATFQRNPSIAR